MKVLAHRCNTIAAVRAAREQAGFGGLEVDVRLYGGEAVLSHDQVRYPGALLLKYAMREWPSATWYLDIKEKSAVRPAVYAALREGVECVLTSFGVDVLEAIQATCPASVRGLLVHGVPEETEFECATQTGCQYVLAEQPYITRDVVRNVSRAGFHLGVWNAKWPRAGQLAQFGAQTFITDEAPP